MGPMNVSTRDNELLGYKIDTPAYLLDYDPKISLAFIYKAENIPLIGPI